jgi:hypothetical protein
LYLPATSDFNSTSEFESAVPDVLLYLLMLLLLTSVTDTGDAISDEPPCWRFSHAVSANVVAAINNTVLFIFMVFDLYMVGYIVFLFF